MEFFCCRRGVARNVLRKRAALRRLATFQRLCGPDGGVDEGLTAP